jgi:gliding motility-associated-like protein
MIDEQPHEAFWGLLTKVLCSLFLLLMSFVSYGQYTSRLGRFRVDEVKGCAPFTVTITATNLTSGNDCASGNCFMNFEGTQQQNTYTHTYSTPGTFKLSVLYQNTGSDDIIITVLTNIKPDFEIYTCSLNKVSLKITDQTYDQYFINYGDGSPVSAIPSGNNQIDSHSYPGSGNFPISIHGRKLNAADNCFPMVKNFSAIAVLPAPTITQLTQLDANNAKLDFSAAPNLQLHLEIAINNSSAFQLFQTLYAVNTYTAANLLLDQNYYCFRLSAYDVCTGQNTYSNTLCSQVFTVTPKSGLNALSWQTSGNISSYSISRNKQSYLSIPAPAKNFDDADVTCKVNYCYQVTSVYTNGSTSISTEKCVDAFTSTIPTRIDNGSAVVDKNGVQLSWLQDPTFIPASYFVYRNQGGGSFQAITSTTTQAYADATYSTSGNYCYIINYTDQCGNTSSTGSPICPVKLSGTADKANVILLSWSGFKGWKNGVKEYTVEKRNQQGEMIKTFSAGTDTTFNDILPDLQNQVVSYLITATAVDAGLTASVSNLITITKDTNIYWPSAFTPDNNSNNDTFSVAGFYILQMELNIFNRWGALVFSTDRNEAWDGKLNGKVMPNDTYVWTAKGTDQSGHNFTKSGTVILLTPGK